MPMMLIDFHWKYDWMGLNGFLLLKSQSWNGAHVFVNGVERIGKRFLGHMHLIRMPCYCETYLESQTLVNLFFSDWTVGFYDIWRNYPASSLRGSILHSIHWSMWSIIDWHYGLALKGVCPHRYIWHVQDTLLHCRLQHFVDKPRGNFKVVLFTIVT